MSVIVNILRSSHRRREREAEAERLVDDGLDQLERALNELRGRIAQVREMQREGDDDAAED